MQFLTGHIEFLERAGIKDESVDLVISNCVINLSPDKASVIKEAYRVLKPGGEMYFSDVYASRRVPEAVQQDKVRSRLLFPIHALLPKLFEEKTWLLAVCI